MKIIEYVKLKEEFVPFRGLKIITIIIGCQHTEATT